MARIEDDWHVREVDRPGETSAFLATCERNLLTPDNLSGLGACRDREPIATRLHLYVDPVRQAVSGNGSNNFRLCVNAPHTIIDIFGDEDVTVQIDR